MQLPPLRPPHRRIHGQFNSRRSPRGNITQTLEKMRRKTIIKASNKKLRTNYSKTEKHKTKASSFLLCFRKKQSAMILGIYFAPQRSTFHQKDTQHGCSCKIIPHQLLSRERWTAPWPPSMSTITHDSTVLCFGSTPWPHSPAAEGKPTQGLHPKSTQKAQSSRQITPASTSGGKKHHRRRRRHHHRAPPWSTFEGALRGHPQ